MRFKKEFDCNQDILKILAVIAMTIDHIGCYLIKEPTLDNGYNLIGRIAFPIFSFLLMFHLSKRQIFKKYILRLGAFGILSSLVLYPFPWSIQNNILFTFLLPVCILGAIKWIDEQSWSEKNLTLLLGVSFLLAGALLSTFLSYGLLGYLFLILLYFVLQRNRKKDILLYLMLLLSFLINFYFSWDSFVLALVSGLTTIFLLFWNDAKKYPRLLPAWSLFYIYYPLHLWVIFMLDF